MPTVKRIKNWLVMIFLNDHRPAHVHVFGAEWEVEVWLEPEIGVKEFSTCSARHARQVVKAVAPHRAELIGKWREIHGDA